MSALLLALVVTFGLALPADGDKAEALGIDCGLTPDTSARRAVQFYPIDPTLTSYEATFPAAGTYYCAAYARGIDGSWSVYSDTVTVTVPWLEPKSPTLLTVEIK